MPEVLTENSKELTGAELDRAIAERVMGWEPVAGQTELAPFAYKRPDGHIVHPYSAPKYSESIEAAMQVVTTLVENPNAGWTVEIRSDDERTDKKWFVEFVTGDHRFLYTGEGASDSLPEAICRAALEAMESQHVTETK